uniref:C-type lectin domain-containing protein n=1 Tax=Strix occidentalis caurina TaxID=311401 RepID=A0A8D0G1I8_STROC
MAAAGPDLYERLQIRYPPSPPARGKPCPAGKPQAGAGSGVEPLPSPAAGWLGVTPASLPQRRHLRPLRQHLAARWAPHWLWPRGCCWCWGPPWSPSSSCVSAAGAGRGRWLQGLALGWRYHDGQIYYFSGEHKAWGEAEAACRSSHSHLVSITSPEEQVGAPYWIGLTATGPGGSWRWVDGAAYSQAQSFWAPGQPDSTDHGKWGLEGCAQIHPVGNGLWNDHNCNFTFAWICKRDLSRP